MKDEEMLDLKRPIIEACIKAAQKNGWSDAMGILWGTLFLESDPLSLDTLAEKTGYSKTTVRSNMNYLENLGIARRVVGPLGKQHRYKQHRYALVTDPEIVRPVVLSTAKEEVHLILQALLQIEKNLEEKSVKEPELDASLEKAIRIYEDTSRILNLISQFTAKELINILESRVERVSAE
ncbi:MAG TPA: DeoR family transcriptional regulator [Methanotrichaceae archaeon]|nr:DeoR family transcriptional regulator [Methanotrichaceae archaeon]HQF15647.1 DeoR family transcriptional regulator [Methanotrichaceae archaeon]HQI90383.1 DeoR family transcriptional regulator [Methanotrichaceae archaeon]HQJ29480.1 DeoR family transcriptional regulator [Methanotrichaceae archaeon]